MNGRMHGNGSGCGCGGGMEMGPGMGMGIGMRGFLTNKEKVEILKEYKTELETELKQVEERISALGKEN